MQNNQSASLKTFQDKLASFTFPKTILFSEVRELMMSHHYVVLENEEYMKGVFDLYSSLLFLQRDFFPNKSRDSVYFNEFTRFYNLNRSVPLTKKDTKENTNASQFAEKKEKTNNWKKKTGVQRKKLRFPKESLIKSQSKSVVYFEENLSLSYFELLLSLVFNEIKNRPVKGKQLKIKLFTSESIRLFVKSLRNLSFVDIIDLFSFYYFDQFKEGQSSKYLIALIESLHILSKELQSLLNNYRNLLNSNTQIFNSSL